MKLSEYLRDQRVERCMSLMDFSKQIGISYVVYSYLEKGIKNPGYSTKRKLLDYFNLSSKQLEEMINENNE